MRNKVRGCRLAVSGFTLIEVLLVVTIFSILSLAIYSTLASGLKLWDRIQRESLTQRKTVLSLEKLSLELRQSLDFSKIGFAGTSKEISFPVLSGIEIRKLTLAWEDKDLLEKSENYKDIVEKREQVQTKKVLEGIEELKFSFAFIEEGKSEYSWKDTWDKEDGIPKIIKIEMKTEDGNLVKEISLPVS